MDRYKAKRRFAVRADLKAVKRKIEAHTMRPTDKQYDKYVWPDVIRKTYWSLHADNKQRFALICFFLVNGVPDTLIRHFMSVNFSLDHDAKRQVDFVLKNYKNKPWTAWHVGTLRTQPINGQLVRPQQQEDYTIRVADPSAQRREENRLRNVEQIQLQMEACNSL